MWNRIVKGCLRGRCDCYPKQCQISNAYDHNTSTNRACEHDQGMDEAEQQRAEN